MIEIIEIKNKLTNGCTIPYVVWCSDGNSYVTKFPGNLQGKKTVINEYIASRLCELLGLPIMNFNLIDVKLTDYKDDMDPDICRIAGTAFGTIYDDKLLTVLNSRHVQESVNNYDAIKILIFDLLIDNRDRNRGNLMVSSKTKKLIMIDHTHIFGLETLWDASNLPQQKYDPFDINKLNSFNYQNLIESLNYDDTMYEELDKFIKKVKSIANSDIEAIMEDIPNDWNMTNDEKSALKEYIIYRFQKVDEILLLLNLKGGEHSEA